MLEKEIGLSFLQDDPGAVKYGNFINYYSFHPVTDRINYLNDKMFPELEDANRILCLDVGCNTGELSIALLHYLQSRFPNCSIDILAIDIDPILIERAIEDSGKHIEFKAGDIMDDECKKVMKTFLQRFEKEAFDITFCFSVTMWIHLNNGDEGLMDFLKYIQSISRYIVMEAQPWKCYKTAQKRLKKAGSSFENFGTLKIRNNVESIIESTLSKTFKKTFETINPWSRRIQCYLIAEDHSEKETKI